MSLITGLIALIGLTLFFLFFRAIPLLILISIPFLIIFLAWKLGRWISKTFKQKILGILVSFIIVAVPIAWLVTSIFQFQNLCKTVPTKKIYLKTTKQDGLIIDNSGIHKLSFTKSFSIRHLISSGIFSYYENKEKYCKAFSKKPSYSNPYALSCAEEAIRYEARYNTQVSKATDKPISEYFIESEIASIGILKFPIYEAHYNIRRISDGKIIAKATDVIFGGGIIGYFLGAFGPSMDGQDNEYLSCGYASQNIGSWRPQNTSDIRWQQYADQDVNFISSVLGNNQHIEVKPP